MGILHIAGCWSAVRLLGEDMNIILWPRDQRLEVKMKNFVVYLKSKLEDGRESIVVPAEKLKLTDDDYIFSKGKYVVAVIPRYEVIACVAK